MKSFMLIWFALVSFTQASQRVPHPRDIQSEAYLRLLLSGPPRPSAAETISTGRMIPSMTQAWVDEGRSPAQIRQSLGEMYALATHHFRAEYQNLTAHVQAVEQHFREAHFAIASLEQEQQISIPDPRQLGSYQHLYAQLMHNPQMLYAILNNARYLPYLMQSDQMPAQTAHNSSSSAQPVHGSLSSSAQPVRSSSSAQPVHGSLSSSAQPVRSSSSANTAYAASTSAQQLVPNSTAFQTTSSSSNPSELYLQQEEISRLAERIESPHAKAQVQTTSSSLSPLERYLQQEAEKLQASHAQTQVQAQAKATKQTQSTPRKPKMQRVKMVTFKEPLHSDAFEESLPSLVPFSHPLPSETFEETSAIDKASSSTSSLPQAKSILKSSSSAAAAEEDSGSDLQSVSDEEEEEEAPYPIYYWESRSSYTKPASGAKTRKPKEKAVKKKRTTKATSTKAKKPKAVPNNKIPNHVLLQPFRKSQSDEN